jgi:hypothetical protein
LTNATSTPTVLSTFSPLPSAAALNNNRQAALNKQQHESALPMKVNDQGYYGSSDYSENNSLVKQEQNYLRQLKQQQQQQNKMYNPYQTAGGANGSVTIPKQSASVYPQAIIAPATNSTSSFASSLLSSPSSSTDSSSSTSDFLHKNVTCSTNSTHVTACTPPITTLYPINVYQSNNYVNNKICADTTTTTTTAADVKIYLEKFERIYNSDAGVGVPATPQQTNENIKHQQQQQQQPSAISTFNSNLNSKQRNSMTTYSYV